MRNVIFYFLALSFILASPMILSAETKDVPIGVSTPGGHILRSPSISLPSCVVDTDLSLVFVSFSDDLGYVDILIENTTTGEYNDYGIDSSIGGVVLPFSATSGLWRITLTLESELELSGEFEI